MKHPLLILLICLLTIFSCTQDENKPSKIGNVSFSLSQKARTGSRIMDTATPAALLISVKDDKGDFVYENKKLVLLTFGQGYISESLKLNTGNYSLTQFIVLDASGNSIYATPLEGSALASEVADPLPINFSVTENGSNTITPQVIAVTQQDTPDSFGYASFGFEIVKMKSDSIAIHFVTDAAITYDSARITFMNGTKAVIRKLQMANGLGTGSVLKSDLGGSGICPDCWNITVSGFFEGVIYNKNVDLQYKESRITGNIQLTGLVSEININSKQGYSIAVVPVGTIAAQHVNYVHGVDPGNYHIEVNADTPCDPHLLYELRSGITYAYIDRTGYYRPNTDSLHAVYYNYIEPSEPFTTNQWYDGSAKFEDVVMACTANTWKGHTWNYADIAFYAESNNIVYSWYYSWDKTNPGNARAYAVMTRLMPNATGKVKDAIMKRKSFTK